MLSLLQYCVCRLRKLRFASNCVFGIVGLLIVSAFPGYGIEIQGINYLNLKEMAPKLNLKLSSHRSRDEGVLVGPDIAVSFIKGKRYVAINHTPIWLGRPILLHKNDLYLAESDFFKAIAPILVPYNYSMPPKLRHIVIDPGHGGKDEGARNSECGLREKDLTLDLSIRLMRELQRMGYKVTLTRQNDHFLSLKDRPECANRKKADLFISIHFNSVETGKNSVSGVETFILTLQNDPSTAGKTVSAEDKISYPGNQYDPWNALLGYNIQSHLVHELQSNDRGLRRGRLAVLKTLECPGVLVEAEFMSNNEECQKIRSPAYRQKMAQSIASGVLAYHKIIAGEK